MGKDGHYGNQRLKIVPPCMVKYHEAGNKEESVDAEVIEPVIGELPETDRIKVRVLEGVKEMATVVHKGTFQTLHMAYNAISKRIEENKYRGTKGVISKR